MIFISYRREDTKAEVGHLHRLLGNRYGKDQVFADFSENLPGTRWEAHTEQKLAESRVLLAVIGSQWGKVRFTTGKDANRLRLDHAEDWVRREICTALRRGEAQMLVVPVLVDDAKFPETEWRCELDQLAGIQGAPLRNGHNFEGDVIFLCSSLELKIPELRRIASLRQAHDHSPPPPGPLDSSDQALRQYLVAELHNHAALRLPIISPVSTTGQWVIAPIDEMRIDLPLTILYERPALTRENPESPDSPPETPNTHTNAVQANRALRSGDPPRAYDLRTMLGPGSRLLIAGNPGSGKSTLLQWISYQYASLALNRLEPDKWRLDETPALPRHDWVPILILCRDLAGGPLPARLEDLLRVHLQQRQFPRADIGLLLSGFMKLIKQGRAILLVDGLDEIPVLERRVALAELLGLVAGTYPYLPVVVTSRVVGLEAVWAEFASRYSRLQVSPLNESAKRSFVTCWSKWVGMKAPEVEQLLKKLLDDPALANLTENVLLLAMIVQMQTLEGQLPERLVDIYRSAVRSAIERRFSGNPPLTVNELVPHLEFLAYQMRKQGVQHCSETDVLRAFETLRHLEPGEPLLRTRTPKALLDLCIHPVGLLHVAGTVVDDGGLERELIAFAHQSFQEYFAGQAISHGRDGTGRASVVRRLREVMAAIRIEERNVNMRGKYTIQEPVFAEYWQNTFRMAIADLEPDEADEAILMLLPDPVAPRWEARPRVIFALHCLADTPLVRKQTALAVFDAAIARLEANDGFDDQLRTGMDKALAAVFASPFREVLHGSMIDHFIRSRGVQRNRVGCCLTIYYASAAAISAGTADAIIEAATRELTSDQQTRRVQQAIALMNCFFITQGKLGFLAPAQQAALVNLLVSALAADEATECAAMWALLWLTGAKYRERKASKTDFIHLDPPLVRSLEKRVQRLGIDVNTLIYGCQLLTREKGIDLSINQLDWIYELAVVADGGKPRYRLPVVKPTGRTVAVGWLINLLQADLAPVYACRIAQVLGALGVFVPEMIAPLSLLFTNPIHGDDERDEALIYLGMVGTREVELLLVKSADTPESDAEDYFYSRGLFGLLLLDNVDILAGQLQKALPHSDLNAYAYGLAGSRDPRGLLLLKQLKNHPDQRIRNSVVKALGKSW